MKLKVRDPKLFRTIFEEYFRKLCHYSFKYTGDINTSKDIVQELFTKLWEGNHSFVNEKALHVYLYNSVKNNSLTIVNKIKDQKKIKEYILSEKINDLDDSIEELDSEIINEIYLAIDQLPPRCKEIFKLSYINNFKQEEVAKTLGISVNTVKTQRLVAKKHLKKYLGTHYLIMLILLG